MRKTGIICGTVPPHLEGLEIVSQGWQESKHYGTAWVITAKTGDTEVFLVPRHGPFHQNPPHEVNYIGNLAVLKQLGVTDVLALSAMGGLASGYDTGQIVIVDDFIDKTTGRKNHTIFEGGVAGHVPRGICSRLHQLAVQAAESLEIPHQKSGTLVVINGPRFGSRAESRIHRKDGAHVVGMTGLPEADIAREMGMCYLVIGQVTDRDQPQDGSIGVTQAQVSEKTNRQLLAKHGSMLIDAVLKSIESEASCDCQDLLHGAILTHPDHVSDGPYQRLRGIFGDDLPREWFAHA